MYPHDLIFDLSRSDTISQLVMDDDFAKELYSALCNMRWIKLEGEVDEILHRLKYQELNDIGNDDAFSVSWRSAGGVVADLRNPGLRKAGSELEDYMNWYCQGSEGTVSPQVARELAKLQWYPVEWPMDDFI